MSAKQMKDFWLKSMSKINLPNAITVFIHDQIANDMKLHKSTTNLEPNDISIFP